MCQACWRTGDSSIVPKPNVSNLLGKIGQALKPLRVKWYVFGAQAVPNEGVAHPCLAQNRAAKICHLLHVLTNAVDDRFDVLLVQAGLHHVVTAYGKVLLADSTSGRQKVRQTLILGCGCCHQHVVRVEPARELAEFRAVVQSDVRFVNHETNLQLFRARTGHDCRQGGVLPEPAA